MLGAFAFGGAVGCADVIAGGDGAGGSGAVGGVSPAPLFADEHFAAVWGSSDDDVWAVGRSDVVEGGGGNGSQCDHAADVVVRRWDGAAWVLQPTSFTTSLADVFGTSANDVWIVGVEGLVAHWDGTAWTASDVSAAAAPHDADALCAGVALQAVWAAAADDVWAVGHVFPSEAGPALILHFNGQSWTRHPVDAADGLFSVWGAAADDVWALGSSGITLHYDGVTWSPVSRGTDQYGFGVWGNGPDDLWAVGGNSITHFDGDDWSIVVDEGYLGFDSVCGSGTSDAWAVGSCCWDGGQPRHAMAMQWNGTEWLDVPVGPEGTLEDVWLAPSGTVWAVGTGIYQLR